MFMVCASDLQLILVGSESFQRGRGNLVGGNAQVFGIGSGLEPLRTIFPVPVYRFTGSGLSGSGVGTEITGTGKPESEKNRFRFRFTGFWNL